VRILLFWVPPSEFVFHQIMWSFSSSALHLYFCFTCIIIQNFSNQWEAPWWQQSNYFCSSIVYVSPRRAWTCHQYVHDVICQMLCELFRGTCLFVYHLLDLPMTMKILQQICFSKNSMDLPSIRAWCHLSNVVWIIQWHLSFCLSLAWFTDDNEDPSTDSFVVTCAFPCIGQSW